MTTGTGKILNLTFLMIFLCVVAGIPALHTDGPGNKDPLCPACHFQSAALATAQIDFFQVPDLLLFDILDLPVAPGYECSELLATAARAPPIV